jgi:hypothetical protein
MRVGKDQRPPAALAVVISLLLLLTSCAQGGGGDEVTFVARLNGIDVSTSAPDSPIEMTDDEAAELELTIENRSDRSIGVRYVRFEGEVLDLIFLTYDTAIGVDLEPGETRDLPPILLDFFDLGGQASGYLRGHVELYDQDRTLLGSEQAFLEASGDGFSTLEQFNVLLLLATVFGAAWNLVRLSQRRLPSNRLVRALRFAAVGVGVGLTLAVAFSTLRIWPLPTVTWLLFVIIGALGGYLVGMILPGADDQDDIDLDEIAMRAAIAERDDDRPLTGSSARSTIVAPDE